MMSMSVVRRKGTLFLVVAICVLLYLLYTLTSSDITPKTFPVPIVSHDNDPQRDIPEKSRLYDTQVKCEETDKVETEFQKQLKISELILIPELPELEKLTREDLAALYHVYIETNQYFCKRVLHLGKLQDGGWDVCHEETYRPKPECLVYSFGINDDFSFDDAVIERYGCMVHSFDPSMHTPSFQRTKMNYFHNKGISSVNKQTMDGWPMETMETIIKNNGHTKTDISILKMDIELWEWDVLPDVIESGVLNRVNTLLVEFHLNLVAPATESGRKTYIRALTLLKKLYDLGFRIFFTHRNPSLIFKSTCKQIERSNCHEVSFLKVKP